MSFLQHLNLVNFVEFGVKNQRNFASPVRLLCKDIDENPPASLACPLCKEGSEASRDNERGIGVGQQAESRCCMPQSRTLAPSATLVAVRGWGDERSVCNYEVQKPPNLDILRST